MSQMQNIIKLSKYNLWANQKMCKWINEINDEQWNLELVSSFTGIKKTALHILAAESLWYERINEREAKWNAELYDNKNKENITQEWLNKSKELLLFCESLNENQLIKNITYTRLTGETYTQPIGEILNHVFNHSTYHRGQIVTLLRQVGFNDVDSTDLLLYYRENP